MTIKSRALGCFMGLPIGDAAGAPVEFKEVGEFVPVTYYRAGGPFNLKSGYWTDDTSMALCLADSILARGNIDEQDIMERFCRWYQLGENSSTGICFDIGNTTLTSLKRFMATKKYEPAPEYVWESGNGGIMRQAPVMVRWFHDRDILDKKTRRQSMTTHGSQMALDRAAELGDLCGAAIRGEDIMPGLRAFANQLTRVPNTGYVLDTMVAAKWAVGSTNSFEEAVLAAVNLGGDSDTIGAVAGQIAGAIHGLDGIPRKWIDGLHDHERLLDIAEQLFAAGEAERSQA